MFRRKKKQFTLFGKKKSRFRMFFEGIDKMWLYTFLAIWIKSLLFLSLLHGKNSATINVARMYFTKPPFLSHILFVVALISFGFLFKNRARAVYYIIMNTLISLMIIGDLFYYRAYGAFLSLNFIKNPQIFNPSGKNLILFHPIDLLFFIDILIVIFILAYNRYVYREAKTKVLAFVLTLVIPVAFIGLDHYRIDVKDTTKGSMMFFRNAWAPFQTMSNLSPIGYHLYDAYRQVTEAKNIKLSEKDVKEINAWYEGKKENIPDNDYKAVFKDKNVIFIQVESLEQFVVNEKVNGEEITPNLNAMLSHSLYFPNIYEQVNNGTSSDADFILNTSLYPVRQGTTFFRYPGNTFNSMPKLMKSMGYNTISTHPENGGNWNWIHFHKSLGFDKSFDITDYNVDETIGPGLSDRTFFKQLVEKLDNEKKPYYAFAPTLTSHGPFEIPKEEKKLNLPKEFDETILGAYFQSVNYVDRQIGNLLNMLKEKGMLKDTVLVIYGDHTGVHKFYQDKLQNINAENSKWLEKDLKIPFIIYNEDFKGSTIETIGGQVDIMPTVAYLMGVPEEKFDNSAMGKILVKTNRNFTVLNYGDIVGMPASAQEKENAVKGIEISDKILQGDYFKDKVK